MRTVYEVTKEDEYTGKLTTLYKGSNKREAQTAKREYPESTFRSYYATKD